jgi:very-short-patch-repair endonuclease
MPTPQEQHVMALLTELGEHFIFEKGFMTDRTFYIADFYLPKPRKVIIEIDGNHHKAQRAYDQARDNFLKRERKIKRIIRISNEYAMGLDAKALYDILKISTA